MTLVLDASVAITWFVEDESNENAWPLLDSVARDGATVPVVWAFETANALLMAERRGRISPDQRRLATTGLAGLPITIASEGVVQALANTLDLASRHRLTVYDAACLELAVRSRLPLASFDRALRTAALAAGVALAV